MSCSKVTLKQYFAASIALECRRMKYDLCINHLKPNANYTCATNFNTQKNLHFAHTVYVFCAIYITNSNYRYFSKTHRHVDTDAVFYLRYELNYIYYLHKLHDLMLVPNAL
jgi:hypothetical protein